MTNYENLAEIYAAKFPQITRENHRLIIMGALGGESPAMSEEGFRRWYDETGKGLEQHPEIVAEIRENPRFVMHREAMILGGDWASKPILDRVKSAA